MEADVFEGLRKAVLEYNANDATKWAEKAVEEKLDPVKTLEVVTDALRYIGDGFGRGDLWLPDLVGGADTAQATLPVIEKEIERTGATRQSLGKVVIGTVFGDIHDIGKAMVAALLRAEGFEVIDLGINIPDTQFVEAVKTHNPDILAMSALLTVTSFEQMRVIMTLKEQGLRDKVRIMVGGGAITQQFADEIGADGYGVSAPKAIIVARQLLNVK